MFSQTKIGLCFAKDDYVIVLCVAAQSASSTNVTFINHDLPPDTLRLHDVLWLTPLAALGIVYSRLFFF